MYLPHAAGTAALSNVRLIKGGFSRARRRIADMHAARVHNGGIFRNYDDFKLPFAGHVPRRAVVPSL